MSQVDPTNPYDTPKEFGTGGQPDAYAAGKVNGPAIGLMVTAGIGMAVQLLSLVLNIVGVGVGAGAGDENAMGMMMQGGIGMVSNFIAIALGVVVLVGALKMQKLQSYGFAMASAIIAMIPCISPCCLLGLPIGIWALVTLNDENVKSAFR